MVHSIMNIDENQIELGGTYRRTQGLVIKKLLSWQLHIEY